LTVAAHDGILRANSMWGVTVNWRGRVSLLVTALIGGGIGIALVQAGMVTPPEGVPIATSAFASHSVRAAPAISGYVLTDVSPSPALATTTADLTQEAKDRWQTTVILSRAANECPGPKSDYWLETSAPDGAYRASSVIRGEAGPCRVTVTFNVALRTPQSASLVLDEAGVVSSTHLSLSRDVRTFEKYGVPFIFGGVMVVVLLIWVGLSVRITGEDGRVLRPTRWPFWRQPIPLSDRDLLKVGGISVATVLATLVAAAGFADALFPGVSLSGFVVLSIIFGMIVAAGPGVYQLFNGSWLSHNPLYLADVALEPDPGSSEAILVDVPAGAEFRVPAGASARIVNETGFDASVNETILEIPPGSKIEIYPEGLLDIPNDTNPLLLNGRCVAKVTNNNGKLTYAGTLVKLPATIQADTGATITYLGQQAYVKIPNAVKIIERSGRPHKRASNRRFTLTSDPERPAASMKVVVATAVCTTLGIGAELGLIGVLAVIVSDGGGVTRFIAGLLVVAVALITLYYSFNTIQTAADNSQLGGARALSLDPPVN
jgi:hypothetical protein